MKEDLLGMEELSKGLVVVLNQEKVISIVVVKDANEQEGHSIVKSS